MVYAAFLVCRRWFRAFCSFVLSSNISEAIKISSEMRKVPQKAVKMTINLPSILFVVIKNYKKTFKITTNIRKHNKYINQKYNKLFGDPHPNKQKWLIVTYNTDLVIKYIIIFIIGVLTICPIWGLKRNRKPNYQHFFCYKSLSNSIFWNYSL